MTTDNMIHTNEYNNVSTRFKKVFGIKFNRFYDHLCSSMEQKVIINIFELDNWLMEKYKEDYNEDMSLAEFIEAKYGLPAREFIESLI